MGILSRVRKRRPGLVRPAQGSDTDHLRLWAQQRSGVEAFVEPKTTVTQTTVVLVAVDGEWTRRRIEGPAAARKLAKSLKIPVYDVQIVGYPQRMRDYDARRRIERDREQRRDLGA